MQHHRHHRHGRWRRFVRHNPGLLFSTLFLVLILGIVVLLFWAMSDARFLKVDR